MRTLPIREYPHPDESFVSYLDKLAAYNDVSLATVLARTGLGSEERARSLRRLAGYGVDLLPGQLTSFAIATRLPEDRVKKMLVASWDGTLCDFQGRNLWDSYALRRASYENWVYFVGSHACPACLQETNGSWKLTWKLPWSFACVKHRSLLIDHCPACERRLGSNRILPSCRPAFLSSVPEPGTCRNALPESRSTGFSRSPCGHSLCHVVTESLDGRGSRILEVQKHIDDVIQGAWTEVCGENVSPLDYLNDLKHLTALIVRFASLEDLGDLPAGIEAAFTDYTQNRTTDESARKSSQRGQKGFLSGIPARASLFAAAVPLAVEMLAAASVEALSESMSPVLSRIRTQSAARFTTRMANLHLPPRLEEAWRRYIRPYQAPAYRIGLSPRNKLAGPQPGGLSADNVPQLFRAELYHNSFADLFREEASETYARLYCSMALVKAIGSYSWASCAAELDLPSKTGDSISHAYTKNLNRRGHMDTFISRIDTLVRNLSHDTELTNFSLRRKAYSTFRIDRETWKKLCNEAGCHCGKKGGRRCHASTWVWCRLTGGYYRLSPEIASDDTPSKRAAYGRFVRDCPDKLRTVLIDHIDQLLESAPR